MILFLLVDLSQYCLIHFNSERFLIELQMQGIQVVFHIFLIEITYVNTAIVIISL